MDNDGHPQLSDELASSWSWQPTINGMSPPPLLPVEPLLDDHDLLLRRDAVEAGISDHALKRYVDCGLLVRLRQGLYVRRATYVRLNDADRHRLLCRGVLRLYGEHVALSHGSACLAFGGPDHGLDLANVHLTHLDGNGRNSARVTHHVGEYGVTELTRLDGHWVSAPARAVLEVACDYPVPVALVQANHMLRTGLTTRAELERTALAFNHWPRSLQHHLVLPLVSAEFESVGEVVSDYIFFKQGLPRPVPQLEVRRLDGSVIGRVDFAWPDLGVIVEFDGKGKYLKNRRPGESIEDAVIREKLREDEIRRVTGWIIIRITWADVMNNPIGICKLIASHFSQNAGRPVA